MKGARGDILVEEFDCCSQLTFNFVNVSGKYEQLKGTFLVICTSSTSTRIDRSKRPSTDHGVIGTRKHRVVLQVMIQWSK